MILLKENSENRIVVTLEENTTLTGATYYLFEFISDDTRESKFFVPEEQSVNVCRFNEFDITVSGGTESFTGSNISIDLEPVGYYKYNVYQQSSPTNLDPELAEGVVELGKMYFSGATKPDMTSYSGNSDNNTYIVYE
jgi:hypothetical protein